MVKLFLFISILFFLVVASCQDFKRREIDDWLNLSLFFFGTFFILFYTGFYIDSFAFFCLITGLISLVFYYGRVFAGGDAKLLFSLSPFFYQEFFTYSIYNFFLFVFLLFLGGSIYGLVYSLYFFVKEKKKAKKLFSLHLKNKLHYLFFFLGFSFFFLGFSFKPFFIIALLLFLGPILFSFAKSTEEVMYKSVRAENLREGDWLLKDISFRGRVIKSSWEGLSLPDITFLKNYSKKIIIKDGIPYAPAFFVGLILYYFVVSIL